MIQHQFLGGHSIQIKPIADVHYGSPECREEAFRRFIQEVAETPNVYLTLGGDLIECGTRNSIGDSVFRQKMPPSQQKKEMAKILEPVRDRLICSTGGNHEKRGGRDADDDPAYDIMALLDLETLYRPNICIVKIQMGNPETPSGNKSKGEKRPCYVLACTHGSSGGVLTGSAVNRNERFAYAFSGSLDILIVGHTHKPFTTQPGRIHIDPHNNRVSIKPFKVVCSTGWLEYGGYTASKMLLPSTHCLQTLTLSGNKKDITITM